MRHRGSGGRQCGHDPKFGVLLNSQRQLRRAGDRRETGARRWRVRSHARRFCGCRQSVTPAWSSARQSGLPRGSAASGWEALSSALGGKCYTGRRSPPATAKQVFNTNYNGYTPAVIVTPTSQLDVQKAIAFDAAAAGSLKVAPHWCQICPWGRPRPAAPRSAQAYIDSLRTSSTPPGGSR